MNRHRRDLRLQSRQLKKQRREKDMTVCIAAIFESNKPNAGLALVADLRCLMGLLNLQMPLGLSVLAGRRYR